MEKLYSFFNNLYNSDSRIMLYVYIAMAIVAVILILVITISSISNRITRKKRKKLADSANQLPSIETIESVESLALEKQEIKTEVIKEEITEIKPEITEIKKEKPDIEIPVKKEEKKNKTIVKEESQSKNKISKEEDSLDTKVDIFSHESLLEKNLDFDPFEPKSQEDLLGPKVKEEKVNKEAEYTNSPVVLTTSVLKDKLSELRTRASQEDIQSIDDTLKEIGLDELPNISDEIEEDYILRR